MADNVAITPGSGSTIRTDDVGGVQYQVIKLDLGGDGVSQVPDTNSGNKSAGTLRVVLATDQPALSTPMPVSGTVTATLGANVTEDAASAGAETSVLIAGVRNDAAATKTSADGDFGNIALDLAGRIGIADLGGSITVDGTVTTTPPSNASTNVAQLAGTTTDTNSGNKSAGTLRVVLATDQPQLTNALKVDPSAVTSPVSIAATVTVADNQVVTDNAGFTDGTSKLFIGGYIFDEVAGTALTENDAAAARVDSKRAVVNVLEDATTRGQRAAISAAGRLSVDASGVAVPVTDNAGSLTVDAPVGTPVFARLSDGAAALTTTSGRLAVDPSGVTSPVSIAAVVDTKSSSAGKTPLFASVSTAASGATQIVAADGTKKIKVVSYVLVADAAVTAKWQSAANDKTGAMSLAANGGVSAVGSFDAHILETAVNEALNLNLGGAVGVRGHISYFLEA